jgi:hypothetical protein
LTRECEQHPELRPGSGVATLDDKPHMDGLKLHPSAKPNAAEQAVADYCNDCIDLDSPCDCLQACGFSEELVANPRCPVCGGTGRPSVKTLVAGIDALNCEIDQLAGITWQVGDTPALFILVVVPPTAVSGQQRTSLAMRIRARALALTGRSTVVPAPCKPFTGSAPICSSSAGI